jgi:hypothetical protein
MTAIVSSEIRRAFAGQDRSFLLRWGEIKALERACGCGIYGILKRLAGHEAYAGDIRDTVRLGLIGGGLTDAEATTLVLETVDTAPLNQHFALAAEIIKATIDGLPELDEVDREAAEDAAKKAAAESLSPETASPFTTTGS